MTDHIAIHGIYLIDSPKQLFFTFGTTEPHVWTAWFPLFLGESLGVMGISSRTPRLGLEDTHLNVRMGLLTLIIIGEGVISVTRIVNKMVAPGGWTMWSFVHILGVTTTVYLLWQSYYDISPRERYGKIRQQIWTQLHFPFHASLILSSEGSQILALTLDIALKLRYLGETIIFACEEPRPDRQYAIALLNDTIVDMEIDFSKGALQERLAINLILNSLWDNPQLCPDNSTTNSTDYALTQVQARNLMGNVTVSLFASMGITPTKGDLSRFGSSTLLMMYVNLLGFVYMYYFVTVALSMGYFAAFVHLTKRHPRPLHNGIAIGVRVLLGLFLLALVSFSRNFDLTYFFMTSPIIIFTFALALFKVLLVDRLLDWIATQKNGDIGRHGSKSSTLPIVREPSETDDAASDENRDEEERRMGRNVRVYQDLRVDHSLARDRSLQME
ncbi:hypothetical protein T310_2779 [Rasamsonia emersonii CBS 393.64]|uniref:Uncharacterized protein n=1 Tax=Rasamsonia emersonii (strain ATCC 16479 / CBS 393.64 / IMI 116815) TaxID=1408163 RepID=A0A0F4YZD9_RASE3|nr:hypothetical protein T310_2779 [Rasamsonia emersonii CBS 393.64]KKA23186.1 hypothetical protein T310_2779 [Rasamsonia emersonii CBS 393.64]